MFRGGALLPGATVASSGAGGGRGGLWPRATPANLIRVRTNGTPPPPHPVDVRDLRPVPWS